jgi:hypothetical protein
MEQQMKFITAIFALSLLFLGGCTGDDKESGGTDSAADSAAE